MIKEERFDLILQELAKKSNVTYETFAQLLGISEDTVRRDIDYLYKNGLLTKIRGGAILRSKDPLSFQERTLFATDAKNVIGLKAQSFIKAGMTIFIDGGTTAFAITKHLPIDMALRIITNNPSLISILSNHKNIELIILGGVYHPETGTTTGASTCYDVNKYIADIYFMGNCAIDYKLGTSATFKSDSEVKSAMIKSSKKIIALADKNKLRRTEPFKVADISIIDILITDLVSNDKELEEFRNIGLQLI